jgi:hypothetical protein
MKHGTPHLIVYAQLVGTVSIVKQWIPIGKMTNVRTTVFAVHYFRNKLKSANLLFNALSMSMHHKLGHLDFSFCFREFVFNCIACDE